WNGSSLSVVQSQASAGRSDLFLRRVAANGQILDPSPIPITALPDDDFSPVVAGDLGHTQVAYVALDPALQRLEDYRAVHVDPTGTATAPVAIDAGLPRQQDVHAVATPFGHLVVYLSKSSLGTRFLAQRLDAYGNVIDLLPIEIATWHLETRHRPSVAFNGQAFMFAWNTDNGTTLVRRYDAQLQPLDAQPVQVFTAATGSPAIAALGSGFLVVGTYSVSVDRSHLRGARVRGSDSVVLDVNPLAIAGNFVVDSRVETFGSRCFVYWVHASTHNSPVTTIEASFVDSNGTVQPAFQLSTTYYAAHPDFASVGTDGVVVYHTGAHGEDGIRAQRIAEYGALVGSVGLRIVARSDDSKAGATPANKAAWALLVGAQRRRGNPWVAALAAM
ncbi:MAG TPA: hypothetical protein PLV92_27590, partial [Pirellulaceae bacterium]|nr:hypothetical protein [Pirellulaceae bacterium]